MKLGLFDRIFPRRVTEMNNMFKTFTAYQPRFYSFAGGLYESELVRAAVEAKAAHISKMEVAITGTAKPKLRAKMRIAPNEWQTWSQFLRRLSTILSIHSTAFIVPVFDDYGEVTGIYPVLPDSCEIAAHNDTPYLRYRFASGDTGCVELALCGIMVEHQHRKDFFGEANESALKPTMDLIAMQTQGITEGVKNASTYRFVAQLDNFSLAEDLAEERKKFSHLNFSAESEPGGILLLPNTYKNLQQLKNTQYTVDSDQMKLIQTNVYNFFGVNERILQNSAKAEDLNAFFDGALEPFAIQLADVLTRMLFTEREIASGTRVSVAANRLQYMSPSQKIELVRILGDRGMISINEGRALLNYTPVENGDDLMPIRNEYVNAEIKTGGESNGES